MNLYNISGSCIVDSQLAKETNIGVKEMMNGCLCCVLVGQMKLALEELKGNVKGWLDFWGTD